LEPEQRIAQW